MKPDAQWAGSSRAQSLRKGDRVFAATGISLGAYTEYICLRENPQTGAIATMPANLSYEEVAVVPYGGGEAFRFLRKANVRSGQRVLVNGVGGSFGTFAVQFAKVLGAHVTAVDSAPKLEMLRTIGADHVIDYTREDFTQGGPRYDVIMDNVASHSLSATRRALTPDGVLIPSSGHAGMGWIIAAALTAVLVRQQGKPFVASTNGADLAVLAGLIDAGKVTPVIDRTYPLSDAPDAFRYLDEGHARGKVVITVEDESAPRGGHSLR